MNDLEQLGQLWSDYLHAHRQANKAIQIFTNEEYHDDKYDKPLDTDQRKLAAIYRQDMWNKLKLSDELYKELVDTTEQYWIKEINQ